VLSRCVGHSILETALTSFFDDLRAVVPAISKGLSETSRRAIRAQAVANGTRSAQVKNRHPLVKGFHCAGRHVPAA
jgi:hypothetical protein